MNNIFLNAYFGKAYKTRDGRKAVIQSIFQDKGTALLRTESKITNGFTSELHINRLDGTSTFCPELDIVSEWQEQQYQPLVDFILEYFEDDPSFICDYVTTEDNDWCFENCENFRKKCIDKWLDIKLKGGNK